MQVLKEHNEARKRHKRNLNIFNTICLGVFILTMVLGIFNIVFIVVSFPLLLLISTLITVGCLLKISKEMKGF